MAGDRLTVRDDRDRSSHPTVPVPLGLTRLDIIQQNSICGTQGIAVQSNVEATYNMRAYTCTNHNTGYKYICGSVKMSSESLYFCEIQTSANHLNYTSFKTVPLRTYTLLPATVKVLETFLEVIL
jgi:ribonucleotide reductase beta subunit family protein with ferritin-like domain